MEKEDGRLGSDDMYAWIGEGRSFEYFFLAVRSYLRYDMDTRSKGNGMEGSRDRTEID